MFHLINNMHSYK